MKRSLKIMLCITIIMAFIVTSMGLATIAVKSIKLNTTSVKLQVGKTYKLKVIFTPSNATNKKITFTSANKSVATVNSTGYIKGIETGKTVITVISASNKKAVAKCNVTISQASQSLKLPFAKGETLTVCTSECYSSKHSFSDILTIFKDTAKRSGINLVWEVIKPDYGTVMQTRLAAGTDLPDIIMLPGSSNVWAKYFEGDLCIPLNDLINNYAPDIKKFYEIRYDLKKINTYSVDGKIHYLPTQIFGMEPGKNVDNYFNPFGVIVRDDLLKTLGLKSPETIDELYNVLKAYKNEGLVPFTQYGAGSAGGLTRTNLMFWSGAFGLHTVRQADGFYMDKNGKLEYEYLSPKLKPYLQEMNKWWSEKLIDNEMSSMNNDKWTNMILEGKLGVVIGNLGGIGTWNVRAKKGVNYQPAKYPRGKNGEMYFGSSDLFGGACAITKSSKIPEIAIKWLDLNFFTEEGIIRQSMGTEGVTFKYVNGKPEYLDSFRKDPEWWNILVGQGSFCDAMLPQIYRKDVRMETFNRLVFNGPEYASALKSAQWYGENSVMGMPKLIPTKEQSDIIDQYSPDIDTYVDEMVVKFITGTESLSNFDKFTAKLKTMGIDKVIRAKQEMVDGYNKAK